MEIWKDIPILEGRYKASSLGRIKNAKTNHIRRLRTNSLGRIQLPICDLNGNRKFLTVSRLIMYAFHGVSDLCVDHINNNPLDNRVCNLRYCTHLENNTIYRPATCKSGIMNIAYANRSGKYFFSMSINHKPIKAPERKTIEEVILDYYSFKQYWNDTHPEKFINHPLEKYY